jgi:hypothetical protein
MFEIPFVSKDVLDEASMTARMADMVTIARKLTAVGWGIKWTVTGLAFTSPGNSKDLGAIREKLSGMDIPDEVRQCSSRSWRDLVTAKAE